MNQHQKIGLLCRAALSAAIIYLFTAYFHVPSHTGYTHVGDGFLYLTACLLPPGYAAAAGAIGAGLADLLSGYAVWMPGTIVIKALTALCFSHTAKKVICTRNLMALVPSWLLCIGGYTLYDSFITGSIAAASAGIPGYVTQVLFSTAVYVALGTALDRLPSLDVIRV